MSWLTFWSWRGAHHGKATRRAVQAQSAQQLGIERAKWGVEHPGLELPDALLTQRERNAKLWAGDGTPWHPVAWWTVLVLAALCGVTVIGLPITAVMAPALIARNPYRHAAEQSRIHEAVYGDDVATMPIPTVPDPCREYRLPREQRVGHTPRDLVASAPSRGRHAR